MSRVLLVDWLGRGGIAHTTGAWADTLTAAGAEVVVATRPGRELDEVAARVVPGPSSRGGRLGAHAALARAAARLIADWRPDLVVVQNFVVAPLERPVQVAATRAGARLVHVIHDHRLHSPLAGTRAGLRFALRAADEVWAHTQFVARAVAAYAGRPTRVVPLPVPPALVRAPLAPRSPASTPVRRAVHFGILKRGYKGTDRVLALAKAGVPGWRFHILGVGAPAGAPGLEASPGFVDAADLVAAVSAADATLLPYRLASQSGAVTLAQALGAVPVASAVGGIPEQIHDGVDGLLLPHGADLAAWRAALDRLARDPEATAAMARAGAGRVWEGHHAFQAAVRVLAGVGTGASPPWGP
jgi:glycosyltransferase involved in cell wall biosynthesis